MWFRLFFKDCGTLWLSLECHCVSTLTSHTKDWDFESCVYMQQAELLEHVTTLLFCITVKGKVWI
jgi:hypothetical protein